MRMSNKDFFRKTGGLLAAALLALPVVGCGPSGDDDDDGGTDPTNTPEGNQATPTPDDATPTPSSGVFPNGQYYFVGVYAFYLTEDTNGPILAYYGFAWDENNVPTRSSVAAQGDWQGLYVAEIWETLVSFNRGDEAACELVEEIDSTNQDEGEIAGVDYSTCQFCVHYSYFHTEFSEDTGCSQEIYDLYYYDDEAGEYDLDWDSNMGYRDAAQDGWPEDYSDFAASLDANGWGGSLYEEFGDGEFVAIYAAAAVNLNSEDEGAMRKAALEYAKANPRLRPTEIRSHEELKKFRGR